MRRVGTRIGLAPVLGGFALALAVVALVVGEAAAQSTCDRCRASVNYRESAPGGKCYGIPPQQIASCLAAQEKAQCYDTKICPSTDPAPDTVACKGLLPPETDCGDTGGTGPCNNETMNVNCASGTSKKCQDVQLPPDGKIRLSACYVKCDCK